MAARFLTRAQVAEELNVSMAQCYALIRRGELRAAQIGGRGDYRRPLDGVHNLFALRALLSSAAEQP